MKFLRNIFGNKGVSPWDLSQGGYDLAAFVTWVQKHFSSMDYYQLKIVHIPISTSEKPALVLKVLEDDYSIWTTKTDIQAIKWTSYIEKNYVIFAFEAFFSAPEGEVIGIDTRPGHIILSDGKNLNKLHFRQFFDPNDDGTDKLVNSWCSLKGQDVVFFVSDSNLNYLSGQTPNKESAIEQLKLAKEELSKISNIGNFEAALESLLKKYPLKQRYENIE